MRRKEVSIISKEQAQTLIDALKEDAFGTVVKLALYTGLRRSEALALK